MPSPKASRQEVLALHEQGLFQADIARLLGVSRARIGQVIKAAGVKGPVFGTCPRCGRTSRVGKYCLRCRRSAVKKGCAPEELPRLRRYLPGERICTKCGVKYNRTREDGKANSKYERGYDSECTRCYSKRIYGERPERRAAVGAACKRWRTKKASDLVYIEKLRARQKLGRERRKAEKKAELQDRKDSAGQAP